MRTPRHGPVFVLLAAVITSEPAHPADAGTGCPAPSITAPAADANLAAARPILQWAPVPGATGYRVRLTSRVPEGGVIVSLDTLTTAPSFDPPQPLTDLSAIVRITVAARCGAETGPETPCASSLTRTSAARRLPTQK